jgi:hypothetical protein
LTARENSLPLESTSGLLRVTLIRLDGLDHKLVWTTHRLIFDGWSVGIVGRELERQYRQRLCGCRGEVPRLTVQFSDFAAWQRRMLETDQWRRSLAFWRFQLRRPQAPLSFLQRHRVRRGKSPGSGLVTFHLDPALSRAASKLARRFDCSLFMVLETTFAIVLRALGGTDRVAVATAIANRRHAVCEQLIGPFVNRLVLVQDLSGEPNVSELLGRTKETVLNAFAHQDLPFEYLLETLEDEGLDPEQISPRVMFVLQNMPMAQLNLPLLTAASIQSEAVLGLNQLDLMLSMIETEHGLHAFFKYNSAAVDKPLIGLMVDYFRMVLEKLTKNPERNIAQLPLPRSIAYLNCVGGSS